MTQPKRRLSDDDGDAEAKIFPLGEARRAAERQPQEPEYLIEEYLLDHEGIAAMEELYRELDESGNIIKTVAFEISVARRHNRSTPYTLFQDDAGGQGLTRHELIDLYDVNPLIQATLVAVHRKHNKGDYQAKHLYSYGLRVFMNMVRYEWLNRTYDPQDPAWLDRASRLGDYDSGVYNVHLQPGHNRQTVVERRSTPSDYLELPPKER